MNYRCIVQYDGTRYEGWQKQKRTEETIQGKLEKTLRKITGEEVQVIGAGRTDAGVHSLGQMVNFHLKEKRKAEEFLIGTYDFISFCVNKKMKKSAVRCISKIEMKEIKGELQIDFTGDSFLQGMVRILVGTLVEVGEGKRKAEGIPAVLESRNREKAGFTAPPQGLILVSVRYEI